MVAQRTGRDIALRRAVGGSGGNMWYSASHPYFSKNSENAGDIGIFLSIGRNTIERTIILVRGISAALFKRA